VTDFQSPHLSDEPENRQWADAPTETDQERRVRLILALRKMGVSEQVCTDLLVGFSLDRIEQQIAWLPFRRAKRRSSMIVASIKGDYERPVSLEEDEGGQWPI